MHARRHRGLGGVIGIVSAAIAAVLHHGAAKPFRAARHLGHGRRPVPGFPQKLLPVMPGAKLVSSSFDKTTVPATVALVGSISAPAADVLALLHQGP